MSLFITVTTACNKTVPDTPTPAPPATVSAISKIDVDGNLVNITYNSDGTIQKVVSQPTGNNAATNYVFSYENGKLKEVDFGGKWKYTYNGDLLVKVETVTPAGKTRYQIDLTYSNNRVVEKTESLVNDVTGLSPQMKNKYQYNADGNVSKKEIFQYINHDWKKTEDVSILEYDTKTNTSERFENLPYLPTVVFAKNNPLRETWLDDLGNIDAGIEHQYVYDSKNRPVSRKTVFKYPGFPDVFSELKFQY